MVPLIANSQRLPFLDLARRAAGLEPDLSDAVDRVLKSGTFLLGPETQAFEQELAAAFGREHAVAVASGTEALRLGLLAMGVGPGDEVIVPAMTAVPTAAAVCAVGAVPVPVDIEPDTAAIDSDAARRAVTAQTRAVIPVHLYGRPAPLPEIGVPILEDAAQAHGAIPPASHGTDATERSRTAAYSFYPTKNLGGIGDGGAVVTDDDTLASAVRNRRAHGMTDGYVHTKIAGNSRMSEIEAAALRVGLRKLGEHTERRREIARRYREAAPTLRWQAPDERHVYHLCVVRVPDRDAFRAGLPFDTALHYPKALTQQPAYAQFVRDACPQAEAWAAECVSLPCFPEMTDDEVDVVCRALQ